MIDKYSPYLFICYTSVVLRGLSFIIHSVKYLNYNLFINAVILTLLNIIAMVMLKLNRGKKSVLASISLKSALVCHNKVFVESGS